MDSYKSNVFHHLDRDRSGYLDEIELYAYFCKEFGATFDPMAIRLVVRIFKIPGTAGLNCEQFCRCYDNIEKWKQAFYNLDKDRSGNIGLYELGIALRGYNMTFTNSTLHRIIYKYDSTRSGALTFVDFFRAMVTIKLLSTRYSAKKGNARMTNFTTKNYTSLDEMLCFATRKLWYYLVHFNLCRKC